MSVRMHTAHPHRRGILRLPHPRRIRTLGRLVYARRRLHPQRFMGPHFVVLLAELPERSLLRSPSLRRRPRLRQLRRLRRARRRI
jgi:hypothetical protein